MQGQSAGLRVPGVPTTPDRRLPSQRASPGNKDTWASERTPSSNDPGASGPVPPYLLGAPCRAPLGPPPEAGRPPGSPFSAVSPPPRQPFRQSACASLDAGPPGSIPPRWLWVLSGPWGPGAAASSDLTPRGGRARRARGERGRRRGRGRGPSCRKNSSSFQPT